VLDARGPVHEIADEVWRRVEPLLGQASR
jgi:hypothetical protein